MYLLDPNDPDIRDDMRQEYLEIIRAIPRERKLESVFELNDLIKGLLADGYRALHPDASDLEVNWALARLWLPENLWQKASAKARERAERD